MRFGFILALILAVAVTASHAAKHDGGNKKRVVAAQKQHKVPHKAVPKAKKAAPIPATTRPATKPKEQSVGPVPPPVDVVHARGFERGGSKYNGVLIARIRPEKHVQDPMAVYDLVDRRLAKSFQEGRADNKSMRKSLENSIEQELAAKGLSAKVSVSYTEVPSLRP